MRNSEEDVRNQSRPTRESTFDRRKTTSTLSLSVSYFFALVDFVAVSSATVANSGLSPPLAFAFNNDV